MSVHASENLKIVHFSWKMSRYSKIDTVGKSSTHTYPNTEQVGPWRWSGSGPTQTRIGHHIPIWSKFENFTDKFLCIFPFCLAPCVESSKQWFLRLPHYVCAWARIPEGQRTFPKSASASAAFLLRVLRPVPPHQAAVTLSERHFRSEGICGHESPLLCLEIQRLKTLETNRQIRYANTESRIQRRNIKLVPNYIDYHRLYQ